jgi:hypothetical protein
MNFIHTLPELLGHPVEKKAVGDHPNFIGDSRSPDNLYDFRQIRMEQGLSPYQTDDFRAAGSG